MAILNSYQELATLIASDLRRSDLTTEVTNAIDNAIRDYGSERFYFNETRSYTFTLTTGTDEYTLATVGSVEEFVKIDWLRIQVGAVWVRLDRIDADNMEELHAQSLTGQPYCWTVYEDKLRLFPTPAQDYPIKIAGHYRLLSVSGGGVNAWITVAGNLIRYSALRRLYAFPVKNVQAAQGAGVMEQDELVYLRRETDRRKRKGAMAPYYG
jgi:hypothetical protein